MTRTRKRRNAYKVLTGILERKNLLGRPERRWQNNINFDDKEIVYEGIDRILQVAGPWIHVN
jgi:hypothetical protein